MPSIFGIFEYEDEDTYRGIERYTIKYDYDYEPDSPINTAFSEYMHNSDADYPFSTNIRMVKEVLQIYFAYNHVYELVEVTEGQALPSQPDALFLGYEPTILNYKRIATGLYSIVDDGVHTPYYALLQFIDDYFRPRINRYGLFDDFAIADHFLRYARDIQQVFNGNFWEHDNDVMNARVVGIWHIK